MRARRRVRMLVLPTCAAAMVVTLASCSAAEEPPLSAGPARSSASAAPATPSGAPATPSGAASSPSAYPAAPAPADPATTDRIRAAYGSCAPTAARMPSTPYRATIGDVDGDGRPDVEWARLLTDGTIQFGVTTAAGRTISAEAQFATGTERSVTIGTLATGQTVALPSAQRSVALYVLNDCRWVIPHRPADGGGFVFGAGASDPADAAGGACDGGRLYQLYVDPSKQRGRVDVTGSVERLSANGEVVTTGPRMTLEAHAPAISPSSRFSSGTCSPSKRLLPEARAS